MKIFANALRKRITASAQPCQSASSLPRHSLRMLLALSILLALLAACGDESSSSVSPEPRQCEEQSDDCDDVSSSSEKISKNSSSSQKSADKGKSSSSEKNAKESSSSATTKNSSSSIDGDKSSSSSAKKEESSSSVVKESSSSTTPKSSGSEEVKQSSSSVVASSSSMVEESSSSEYKPYNHQKVFSSDSLLSGAYKQFTDTRNGRTYYYLTINGENKDGQAVSVTVMAENLNVGEMVDGDKDQSNDSKIERYCYDNDTTQCDRYGGLYQWAEMMQLPSRCNTESCADLIKPNHQGICPDGWRLLTVDDFYIVLHADGNDAGVKGVRAMGFGGHNYNGYSLIGSGLREGDDGLFYKLNSAAFWYFPIEQESRVNRAGSGSTNSSTTTFSQGFNSKNDGFSVRCVMVE